MYKRLLFFYYVDYIPNPYMLAFLIKLKDRLTQNTSFDKGRKTIGATKE